MPLRSQGSCSGREDGAWRVDGVDLGWPLLSSASGSWVLLRRGGEESWPGQ